MATWKEKGVVPDSDDDEDSLDSQSNTNNEDAINEERNNGLQYPHDAIQEKEDTGNGDIDYEEDEVDLIVTNEEEGSGDPVNEIRSYEVWNNGHAIESNEEDNEDANSDYAEGTADGITQDGNINLDILAKARPASLNRHVEGLPPAFKDPRTIWDVDNYNSIAETSTGTAADSNKRDMALGDEAPQISHVLLTSPMSSILSSPPASQESTAIHSRHVGGKFEQWTSPNHSIRGVSLIPDDEFQEPINSRRRALRQRNLIQLHPYVVEQEKYRQTMKARGVAPMRLAETGNGHAHKGRAANSPNPSSQEDSSQQMYREEEDTQPVNFDWDSVPPSSGLKPTETDPDENLQELSGNEDEEFPDIDELFRRMKPGPPKPTSKKRSLKAYSTKFKRSKLLQTQPLDHDSRRRDSLGSVFNIPASPPATSSPFPVAKPYSAKVASRALSISSKEPTTSWVAGDVIDFELPTPAPSAAKLVPESSLRDSDDDSDDGSRSKPSSEESVLMQKLGKKIRGVLPASHLRLDQHLKKINPPSRTNRDNLTASPAKQQPRRGVALPKVPTGSKIQTNSTNAIFSLTSDESDESEGDNEGASSGSIIGHGDTEMFDQFAQARTGDAEEDDTIDAMLPSRKRQRSGISGRPRKKKRTEPTFSSRMGSRTHSRQPTITEHLSREPFHTQERTEGHRKSSFGGPRKNHANRSRKQRRRPLPRLSILDVVDTTEQRPPPGFLRVAARTARGRNGQGRQSPSRKFIRLANREDTYEVQSILRDWREGKIQPRDLNTSHDKGTTISRKPLGQIANNRQTKLQSPIVKSNPTVNTVELRENQMGIPRKLLVSTTRQRSVTNFVLNDASPLAITHQRPSHGLKVGRARNHGRSTVDISPHARPAQLEASEAEYSYEYPSAAFKNTKKALDSLYRALRKRKTPQVNNLQLGRFLADEEIVRRSIETDSTIQAVEPVSATTKPLLIRPNLRQKKWPPRRLDAGAAIYRQPSEPLILDLVVPSENDVAKLGDKLVGLGKFGTHYPIHFDILPLQAGIFFQQNTFIGSGRLATVLKGLHLDMLGSSRQFMPFRIGERAFRWGAWDEDVSSEIGLCFDWLLDQLRSQSLPPINPSTQDDPVAVVILLVDYVQDHISFSSLQERHEFLSRMLEIIREFLSQLSAEGSTIQVDLKDKVEVVSRCLILGLQLLQISRGLVDHSAIVLKLEDLIADTSSYCINLLLVQGLENVRKLYDNLQYLSFRERGIDDANYYAQAWVIVLKVLNTSRIPRKSFWDVTNTQLLEGNTETFNDARVLEKIWYSLYSLLPLCEFDDFGVVVDGARKHAAFDNWALPQKILKNLFALCSSKTRQSPAFNDYCRASVSRCHFLMQEWGWWNCSGVIGTIFDFFASQNLEHLRNEEVHKSPRFLEELDGEPSLLVEPEDRCFHILLKMIALAIKHMSQENGGKGIRNLVTRLLPNHNRQYPKEEDLLERELAALRNHHDLLCTLYWVSPTEYRPSIALIQELVVAGRSHNEACLINLRAWRQLARFVLISSDSSRSPTWKPFITWQNTFFSTVLDQYIQEDLHTRIQAQTHQAPGQESISEVLLQQQIASNRSSTMAILRETLRTILYGIQYSLDWCALIETFNTRLLTQALNFTDNAKTYGTYRKSDDLIQPVLEILQKYLDKTNMMYPYKEVSSKLCPPQDDSQESFGGDDISQNVERESLTFPLREQMLPKLYSLIQQILDCRLYRTHEPEFMENFLDCWSRFTAILAEDSMPLQDFLPGGCYAAFPQRHGCGRANKYWPLFLRHLIRCHPIDVLKSHGLDVQLEWILALAVPPLKSSVRDYQAELTQTMIYREKPLGIVHGTASLSPQPLHKLRNRLAIRGAIDDMRMSLGAEKDPQEIRKMQTRFSFILKELMDTMQCQLESMIPRSPGHIQYVEFSQSIISSIRARGSGIQPLTPFFGMESVAYWPDVSDPKLYTAGIISYALRLRDQPGKTSSELFHYLYSGWRNCLMIGQLDNHVAYIKKGLKYWDFTEFMLASFIPAVLEIGFNSPGGWILPSTYLPAVANQVRRLLERGGTQGSAALGHLIDILKIFMNEILTRSVHCQNSGSDILGIHPEHRGMISTAYQFWLSVSPDMKTYLTSHVGDERAVVFENVSRSLDVFAETTLRSFMDSAMDLTGGIGDISLFVLEEGPYMKNFVGIITDDLDSNWRLVDNLAEAMWSGTGWIEIYSRASATGGNRVDLAQLWGPPLREVLEIGSSELGAGCTMNFTGTTGLDELF